MNKRSVVLGVLAAGLVLGQQACSSAEPVPVAAAPTTSAPAGSAPAGSAPTSSAPADQVAACRNEDVSAELTLQPGKSKALLALRNKTSSPCRVEGHASVSLRNAADEVVDVPTKEVDEPGPGESITLKPDTNAFAGIVWVACDKGDSDCPAGNSLSVNLQGTTDGPYAKLLGFPDPAKSNITMKSLRVGTLQPSTQGVVAW